MARNIIVSKDLKGDIIEFGMEGQEKELPVVYFPLDEFPIRKKARVAFKFVLFWEHREIKKKHRVSLSRYTDPDGKEWLRWFVEDDVTYYAGLINFYVVGLSWFCERVQSAVYMGIVDMNFGIG